MYQQVWKRMVGKINAKDYIVTWHADDAMADEDLVVEDIERAILTGNILYRQRDRETQEWKYVVRGVACDNEDIEVVAKFGLTDKLIIITSYRL